MSDVPITVAVVHGVPILSAATRNNVPAVYYHSDFARDGGLLSYGHDGVEDFRRAASYVDRILRGAKPAELPVQLPTKFETSFGECGLPVGGDGAEGWWRSIDAKDSKGGRGRSTFSLGRGWPLSCVAGFSMGTTGDRGGLTSP
jgi:ABC transporter substrate binding protein